MFYCQACAVQRGWPQTTMRRSYGKCETCGISTVCNDLPSSWLERAENLPTRRHRPKTSKINPLPEPDCKWGYTHTQIDEIMGTRVNDFHRWMRGQTVSLCEGTEWDYASGTSVLTQCGPHGVVIYRSDVEQFLRGGRPLD